MKHANLVVKDLPVVLHSKIALQFEHTEPSLTSLIPANAPFHADSFAGHSSDEIFHLKTESFQPSMVLFYN